MKRKLWFRLVVALAALLLAASGGLSQALHHGWGRRFLLARLSASFGRSVEARGFAFTLLNGPSLEADAVTVAEDPRFGQEYFLRADQLTATLHWSALLRGRVEFGTLSFSHPSLNLVRAADGRWNIQSWLPPAPSRAAATDSALGSQPQPPSDAMPPAAETRLSHIVVDDGRINFKLGAEKLLFALTDVSGRVDQDSSGRWDLDVQADPLRASVDLQEAGTLRLRGTVAGTSARLRPAVLTLTWEDASLADALRLAGGQDYGVRGMLGAELSAQIEDFPGSPKGSLANPVADPVANLPTNQAAVAPDRLSSNAASQWRISGKFHLAGIHRWDLPARADDPGLNLAFTAAWRPESGLAIEPCLLETAHSQVHVAADADWSHGFKPSVRVLDSRISFDDLLEWARSFRPALPDGFSVEGALQLQAALLGWPLRVGEINLAGTGAIVHLPGLGGPVRVGPISASIRDDSLVLAPVSLSLPAAEMPARARAGSARPASPAFAAAGVLHVEGSLGPWRTGKSPADWPYRVAVSGRTTRAQDLLTAIGDFAHPMDRASKEDWSIAGPLALQLAWLGTPRHMVFAPSGTLSLSGVQVASPVLNRPLLVSSADVELSPGERHVKLTDVEGIGASWKGTLDWNAAERIWRFDLAADCLNAAELDRWLGPGARPGFFARVLPFIGDDAAAARNAAIQRLAARGQLHVAELALAPVEFQRIEASVELKGRNLSLSNVQAEFSEGRVLGNFSAHLTPDPSYSFRGQFDSVDLGALTLSQALPEGRLGGLASGDVALMAHGVGTAALLASLSAQADFRVREPILRGASLAGLDQVSAIMGTADSRSPGEIRLRAADASVHMSSGVLHVDRLSLAGRDANLEAQGSVDLARRLDLRVWSVPRGSEAVADSDPPPGRAAGRLAERVLPPPRGRGRNPERNPDRQEWSLGGTLDAPLVTRQASLAGDLSITAPLPTVVPLPPPPASPSYQPPFSRR